MNEAKERTERRNQVGS